MLRLLPVKFFFILMLGSFSACSTAENPGPQISVSGSGKITAQADEANINLNLTAQAVDSKTAKEDVDKRINAFFAAIKKLGIEDHQITAGSMSLFPQYDYQNRKQRFIGFQASRNIQIEISDLEKIHPVLDTAISMKINGIQGIHYASSTEDDMRQQARLAAIQDSKSKAKQLAEAYGAKLGPVYSIRYHSGQLEKPYQAQPEMALRAMSDGATAGGRFIPGEVSVSDNIHVVFDLITN